MFRRLLLCLLPVGLIAKEVSAKPNKFVIDDPLWVAERTVVNPNDFDVNITVLATELGDVDITLPPRSAFSNERYDGELDPNCHIRVNTVGALVVVNEIRGDNLRPRLIIGPTT